MLDDHSALCLYIRAGDSPWEYCGCVANAKPSDVFALRWGTRDDDGFASACIGVSVEPMEMALEKEKVLVQHKETFAKRVAEDLFQFMQSFQIEGGGVSVAGGGGAGATMLVPTNILTRWYEKFINRFRRDPGFLERPRLDTA